MIYEEFVLPNKGDNIIRTHDLIVNGNSKEVAHEIYHSMKNNKNKCAQIDPSTGIFENFSEVLERSIRVACHLKKLGVTPEDVLSPCITNNLNTSVVFYAIIFTGAKPACMHPGTTDDDKLKQLKLVKSKYVFATPEAVESLENVIENLGLETKIIVFGKTKQHILIPLPDEEKIFQVYTNNNSFDTIAIVFTSGTTGTPKGVCLTHYQMLGLVAGTRRYLTKTTSGEEPVFMNYASLVWISAVLKTFLAPLIPLINLVCSNFKVEEIWNHLKTFKVSTAMFSYQDAFALVKSKKPKGLELPHLKVLILTGGATSLETLTKLKEMFPTTDIFPYYSQSELGGFGLFPFISPEGTIEVMEKSTSIGKPMKGGTYKIVDPETKEILGPNKPGELRIKTKMIMNGYYKEDNHDYFDSTGFFKTGDIMYYDESYSFFYVERLKEILKYKGFMVAPTELEAIIIEHPSVALAVVLGLPSDEGEIITAVVVKSNDNVTAEELEELVASKVQDRKRLKGGVKFLSMKQIPFTPNGKIKRRTLRQYVMEKYI